MLQLELVSERSHGVLQMWGQVSEREVGPWGVTAQVWMGWSLLGYMYLQQNPSSLAWPSSQLTFSVAV